MAQIRKVYRSAAIDCMIMQRHTIQDEHGPPQYRVILLRRGQDTSGSWHSSTRFTPDDLPVMVRLLARAHHFLLNQTVFNQPKRPIDHGIDDIDLPDLRQIHDAILASQIHR